jgi:S-adenosylmethionine:tRNA ribosyltransferase-isomerase
VIAVGTTVVRALEHASQSGAGQSGAGESGIVPAGSGVATQRVGEQSTLRIVDAVLSGTHEIGSSHYDLLRAFTADHVLRCADEALLEGGYLTHEFGDSVLLERGNKIALERSWGLGRRCIAGVQRDLRFA